MTLLFNLPSAADVFGVVPTPPPFHAEPLVTTPARIAAVLTVFSSSLQLPVAVLIAVLVCRLIFRRPWLAYSVVYLVAVVAVLPALMHSPLLAIHLLAVMTVVLVMLSRLGLLAFIAAMAFSSWPTLALTADSSSWFFVPSMATMAVFATIAIYGFVVSLGGQTLIKDAI